MNKDNEMYCAMCDYTKKLTPKKTSVQYTACGLDNIFLKDVIFYKCPSCGETYYNYGNLDKLHYAIAALLLRKQSLLIGKEVRFLRSYLGYSGRMFAHLIGYSHEALSRIENGKTKVVENFDRLVRFSVLVALPVDRNYDAHDQILNKKGIDLIKIELKQTDSGEWSHKYDIAA